MENTVAANEYSLGLIQELKVIKKNISLLQEEEEDIKRILRDKVFGENEALIDNYGEMIAIYRFVPRNSFDQKLFKQQNPSLYDKYVKKTEGRILILK